MENEDEEMWEQNKEVPQHIALVVEILHRCIHFVSCVGVNELILVLKVRGMNNFQIHELITCSSVCVCVCIFNQFQSIISFSMHEF